MKIGVDSSLFAPTFWFTFVLCTWKGWKCTSSFSNHLVRIYKTSCILYKQVDVCPCNMGQIEVLEEDNDSRRSMKKRRLTYNLLNYHSFHEDSIEWQWGDYLHSSTTIHLTMVTIESATSFTLVRWVLTSPSPKGRNQNVFTHHKHAPPFPKIRLY